MTKQEIYKSEQSNDKDIVLYPEGKFYKAYERSAWRLCMLVHEFKASCRWAGTAGAYIVSVGFPLESILYFRLMNGRVDAGGQMAAILELSFLLPVIGTTTTLTMSDPTATIGHRCRLAGDDRIYEQGRGGIISHDFNEGVWRVRWKVGAK